MPKVAARNASLGIIDSTGACVAFSSLTNSISLTYSSEAPEVTGFGENTRQRMNDGIKDYELTADMFFATGAAETDAKLSPLVSSSTRFAFGPTGSTAGSIWYSGDVILTNYEMTFGLEDAGQCSVTLVPWTGSLTRGVWL